MARGALPALQVAPSRAHFTAAIHGRTPPRPHFTAALHGRISRPHFTAAHLHGRTSRPHFTAALHGRTSRPHFTAALHGRTSRHGRISPESYLLSRQQGRLHHRVQVDVVLARSLSAQAPALVSVRALTLRCSSTSYAGTRPVALRRLARLHVIRVSLHVFDGHSYCHTYVRRRPLAHP